MWADVGQETACRDGASCERAGQEQEESCLARGERDRVIERYRRRRWMVDAFSQKLHCVGLLSRQRNRHLLW